MPKFTVGIIGGGLTGLVFALSLQKYAPDVDFQVYEAAVELTEIGAGIGFHPRTWYIMRQLGLEEALMKIAGTEQHPALPLLYRKSDQREGLTFSKANDDAENFPFHRAQVQKVFLDHIQDPKRIHLSKRFVSYTLPTGPDGQIEIRFQDGSTATCDVLAGADGIKSTVRANLYTQFADAAQAAGRDDEARLFTSCIAPFFTGTVAYRALIEQGFERKTNAHPFWTDHIVSYCGKNKHVVAFPIAHGRMLNIVAAVVRPDLEDSTYEGPWATKVSKEEITREFVGWEPEVEELVQAVDASGWSKWAIHAVRNLPTFVDGRVALLGDAAHAMTPHQAAGAGQGFEDAFVLEQLLAHPKVNRDSIPTALKIYDEIRRPFVQHIAALSRQSGQLHSLIAPGLSTITPEISASGEAPSKKQLERIAETIEQLKQWRQGTTIEKDREVALQKLEAQLA
ncbi:FAD/NAD(P)-binding domain-containing protein [Trametes punicea]|nr:FAD/NAD(P)-binding domain-containing protein [Trametes punicea]